MFDRMTSWVAQRVASPIAFSFALGLVVAWLFMGPLMGWSDDFYHLLLNSPTTAITFLLVFLLHNEANRNEKAINRKLDAQTKALVRMMERIGHADAANQLKETLEAEKPDGDSTGTGS